MIMSITVFKAIRNIINKYDEWHEKQHALAILEHHGVVNPVFIRKYNDANNHVIIVYRNKEEEPGVEHEFDAGYDNIVIN